MAGPSSSMRHAALFGDVHSAMHNVSTDLAHFRQMALDNDQARSDEIVKLRKKLDQERLDHREQLNRFRYEFDDLVHTKIEKLIDMIEVIHRTEKKDDREQKEHIESLRVEMQTVKKNLKTVTSTWCQFTTRARHVRAPAVSATAAIEASGKNIGQALQAQFGGDSPPRSP